jgi:hypothetical protein
MFFVKTNVKNFQTRNKIGVENRLGKASPTPPRTSGYISPKHESAKNFFQMNIGIIQMNKYII